MSCISLRSRTPQSGGSSDRGSKRRSVGERRLHLRKTPPSRDRSAHPLLINAAEGRRGSGPEAQKKLDQVFFLASVLYANERATRTITIVCASVPTSRLTGDPLPVCCLPAFRKSGRLHSRCARPAQAEAVLRDG